MKKIFIASILTMGAFGAFADSYTQMAEYKQGDSLEWYFELINDSQKQDKIKSVEDNILKIMAQDKLSLDAYFRACQLLRPIASADSVKIMQKYLTDAQKSAKTADVLLGIKDSSVDKAYADALKKAKDAKVVMNLLYALSLRYNEDNLKVIYPYTSSKNKEVAEFATSVMVRLPYNKDLITAYSKIAAANDFRKDVAYWALAELAQEALVKGDLSQANLALKGIADKDYYMAIPLRGITIQDDKAKQAYFNSYIERGGEYAKIVGRPAAKSRTFEGSKGILDKLDTFTDDVKMVVIGNAMQTADPRFYPYFKKYMTSSNNNLASLALYSARYLANETKDFEELFDMYITSKDKFKVGIIRNILTENPSDNLDAYLKTVPEMSALAIRVNRGDKSALDVLFDKFFAKDKSAANALGDCISFGDLDRFASNYKKYSDEAIRSDMSKLLIKKIGKNKFVANKLVNEILVKYLDPEDTQYKLIVEKLSVKPAKK